MTRSHHPMSPAAQARADGWKRVVFAAEVDDSGLCPVCIEIDFADCPCPGPTMHELYEYQEIEGELMAKLKAEADRG